MTEPLLLGIDEGTTGVKAALFDEELRAGREARRDKVNRHPQPGWVEQDGDEVLDRRRRSGRRAAGRSAGRGRRLRARPPGRVGAGLGRGDRRPLSPDRRLAGQALAGGARPDGRRARRRSAASGLPFDPYFSAAKLAWLLEHDEGVQRAREAGTLRMGTVDSFLCDRLGAGFATDASTASRTQLQRSTRRASIPGSASASASRPRCCPRSATPPVSSAPLQPP